MSICNNPYAILPIGLNECIGLSLNTINSYYELLKDETCSQNNEIVDLETEVRSLSSYLYALSGSLGGIPKAYVTFSGRVSTIAGTLEKIHSYNVDEVGSMQPGEYRITLAPEITGQHYGVLATCSQLLTGNGFVFATTTAHTLTSVNIKILNKDGNLAVPNIVAVSFFNNK